MINKTKTVIIINKTIQARAFCHGDILCDIELQHIGWKQKLGGKDQTQHCLTAVIG